MTRNLKSKHKRQETKEDISIKLKVGQKSKSVKIGEKKTAEVKKNDIERNSLWNINPILSNIFSYIDFKDLVEFNTVCKKWSQLTNPIIHRTIKLQRNSYIQNQVHDKRLKKSVKVNAEIDACISNNAKYAPFIKEFTLSEKLELQRNIKFFETFKFITNLNISGVNMNQDHFLGMVKPLTQLQELNLSYVTIKKIAKNAVFKESVQLPPTLAKISFDHVFTSRDPELFIETINSHTNLIEFKIEVYDDFKFLDPFLKYYPSFQSFEYINRRYHIEDPVDLYNIFEFNPQLIVLKLQICNMNDSLARHISHHLTILEEFYLIDCPVSMYDHKTIISKFSQPTKIKKLNISWNQLSSCSLESIILNCPELKKLSLTKCQGYDEADPLTIINLCNHTKIKSLQITCDNISESSLDSILINSPQLRILEVNLPRTWKYWIRIIGKRCINLEKLIFGNDRNLFDRYLDSFFQEFYEVFLSNNLAYKNTLKYLILKSFNFNNSNFEYFENFPKLKIIRFSDQYINDVIRNNLVFDNMKSWPNFKLRKYDTSKYCYDIELAKLHTV